jgi:hypothetical protein
MEYTPPPSITNAIAKEGQSASLFLAGGGGTWEGIEGAAVTSQIVLTKMAMAAIVTSASPASRLCSCKPGRHPGLGSDQV